MGDGFLREVAITAQTADFFEEVGGRVRGHEAAFVLIVQMVCCVSKYSEVFLVYSPSE